jgi:hypothetical protein
MLERLDAGIDWIGLAQDRDKWRAHMSNVMSSTDCSELLEWCTTGGISSGAQLHREKIPCKKDYFIPY